MDTFVLAYEPVLRLGPFLVIFVVVALWEVSAPRRRLSVSKALRWVNNLSLIALNTILLRLLFPAAAVGFAATASVEGWGLLNQFPVPVWAALPAAVIAMDFVIWLQHVGFHAVPTLWRLHRVHHADPDYDLTTGSRFHPIEIVLSMLVKLAAIAVLGPSVEAVIIFEVILNGMAMFNHANARLPQALDGVLRWLVITPDVHRVHHSVEDDEANSNFGFNLSCWDRLFGTYRAQPRDGHLAMKIGIHHYDEPKLVSWLPGMLLLPFVGKITGYTINRREWRGSSDE